MTGLPRYRTVVSDSALWSDFRFRTGDVVISTPAKCGTTWMQMLCALLIFDTADFGRPLTEISPWLDAITYDTVATLALLEGQEHRRRPREIRWSGSGRGRTPSSPANHPRSG